MVSILVGPIFLLVQYFIWTAVYGSTSTIGGLDLPQMIRYFGASSLIGYLTMDFADWNLQMLVRTGKFLTFSLRPIHHRFFALSQKFGHRVLGLLVEFVPCLIIFVLLFRIDMMPENILLTAISVILAFFVNFYVNYTLGLLGFWLVDASGISRFVGILTSIFSGTLVPLTLFPEWAQIILLFMPMSYMGYAPAMIWTTGHFTLGGITMNGYLAIAFQLIAACFMFAVSEAFYKLSIKRFSGVGA
jgi:ABC-2 type transport system permease protein